MATENLLVFGDTPSESLMLPGDQDIVDMKFTVLWKVNSPTDYLFNITEPEALRDGRRRKRDARDRRPHHRRGDPHPRPPGGGAGAIQATFDSYKSGILVSGVQLEKADPPPQVVDAFEEVQRAEQNGTASSARPNSIATSASEARGEASKIVEDAKGYTSRVVNEAQGESQRFVKIYDEYAKAPEVTRQRMYLETLEEVLAQSNKVILEKGMGPGGDPVSPVAGHPE